MEEIRRSPAEVGSLESIPLFAGVLYIPGAGFLSSTVYASSLEG